MWSVYNINKQCTLHCLFKCPTRVAHICVLKTYGTHIIPLKSVQCTAGPSTHLGSHMFFVLSKITAEINYAICEQQTDSSTP